MEMAYKVALEIIKKMCENEKTTYLSKDDVMIICETVLGESEESEDAICS